MSRTKIIHLFTLRKQLTLFQQRKSPRWKVDCCDNGMWHAWIRPTPQSINPTTWKCNLIQSAVNLGIDASANGWQSVISETKFANFEWLHQLVEHHTEKQIHLHQILLQNGLSHANVGKSLHDSLPCWNISSDTQIHQTPLTLNHWSICFSFTVSDLRNQICQLWMASSACGPSHWATEASAPNLL